MTEITKYGTPSPFDALMQLDAEGEYWSARDLQTLMGYSRWEDFRNTVERAKSSARNTGEDVDRSFSARTEHVATSGKTPDKVRGNYRLTRHAAYLTAMNGDPTKPEIAAAQHYFATKTRQAEVARLDPASPPPGMSTLDVLAQVVGEMARVEREALQASTQARAALDSANASKARLDALEGHYDEFAALGYAKLNNLPTDRAYLIRLGMAATRAMSLKGETPRKRQDATFGSVNVYPVWALDEGLVAL